MQIYELICVLHEKQMVLSGKYIDEMQRRKRLHNELVAFKGNIRVFCRIRPVIAEDCGGKFHMYTDDEYA